MKRELAMTDMGSILKQLGPAEATRVLANAVRKYAAFTPEVTERHMLVMSAELEQAADKISDYDTVMREAQKAEYPGDACHICGRWTEASDCDAGIEMSREDYMMGHADGVYQKAGLFHTAEGCRCHGGG